MAEVQVAAAATVAAAAEEEVQVLVALKAAAMAVAVLLVEVAVVAMAVATMGRAKRAKGGAEVEKTGTLAVGSWAEAVMAAEASVAAADKESNLGQLSTPRRRSEARTASASLDWPKSAGCKTFRTPLR